MITWAYLATTPHCWLTLQLTSEINCIQDLTFVNSILLVLTICFRLPKPFQVLIWSCRAFITMKTQVTRHFESSPTMPWFKSLIKIRMEPTAYHFLAFLLSKSLTSPFYGCDPPGSLFSSLKRPSLFCYLHYITHTKTLNFNGIMQPTPVVMTVTFWHWLHTSCISHFFQQNTASTTFTCFPNYPAWSSLSQSLL